MIAVVVQLYCLVLLWSASHAWTFKSKCLCTIATRSQHRKSIIFLSNTVSRPQIRLYNKLSSAEDDVLPDKAQVRISLEGPHSANPLFRAEVKKELTFFRGCHGLFIEITPSTVLIVAEGKRVQLDRFLSWLKQFSIPLTKRKPNFQSPRMMVDIRDIRWETFSGRLTGFQASNKAPDLTEWMETCGEKGSELRAGTDESV